VREDIDPVQAEALREAARRVLEFGEPVGAICRDWNERGIKPVAAKEWHNTSLVLTLISARLAGFREWQGQKYPTTQWPAIFDLDTHERLVKLFRDPARRPSPPCLPSLPGMVSAHHPGNGRRSRRTGDGTPSRPPSRHTVTIPLADFVIRNVLPWHAWM
jgi:hypothetical protein